MLRVFNRSILPLAVLALTACTDTSGFDAARFVARAAEYDATIHRDRWGVPHVYGKTDADVAFGFAFAQAEDCWPDIEAGIPLYRGERARREGQDAATSDYLVQWLGIWKTIDARYDEDLTPGTRRYLQAFADGLNYWAAKNPDAVDKTLFPLRPQDLVAGFMLRHLMFYGLERDLAALDHPPAAAVEPPQSEPTGSNAFAVAPGNTPDRATRLLINSHQPLTGPVAWYEGHLKSDEGLDIMGGVFPGSPTISLGFTATLGWGATVNHPDLVDIYRLDMDPEDPDRYRLDGRFEPLEKSVANIPVKLFPGLVWTFEREIIRSRHGPALRKDHGVYAVRYAGMNELRQVEQWHRMNHATNFDEWYAALAMQTFASFNFVYADRNGTIAFIHNSLTPVRDQVYDWTGIVAGDKSALIPSAVLPLDRLPQVVRPSSGYVLSANQSPFDVSGDADNPPADNWNAAAGFETHMTNRALRGLELLEALGTISADDARTIKYDHRYSPASEEALTVRAVLELDFTEPELVAAEDLLAHWDLSTDRDNRGAPLGVCLITNAWRGGSSDPAETLRECVSVLTAAFGRIDPPWGAVNRHRRGSVDLPVQGGPDTLRAIYGAGIREDGTLHAVAGDGLFYFVEWDAAGALHATGIHHFGSTRQNEQSPHYADQAPLFAREETRELYFEHDALMKNVERSYRP